MTVTKNTIIAEILNNDPTQGCVPIFLSTGMHCLGCMASHGETVEEACAVHGVDRRRARRRAERLLCTPVMRRGSMPAWPLPMILYVRGTRRRTSAAITAN